MCDTELAFWRSIEACPEDRLRREVFADYLEEQGRWDEGAAVRETVDKCPKFYYENEMEVQYAWISDEPFLEGDEPQSLIPEATFSQLSAAKFAFSTWYSSFLAAMLDLISAWVKVNRQESSNSPCTLAPV